MVFGGYNLHMGMDAQGSGMTLRRISPTLIAPVLLLSAIGVVGVGGGGLQSIESLRQVASGPTQPVVAQALGRGHRGPPARVEAQVLTPEAPAASRDTGQPRGSSQSSQEASGAPSVASAPQPQTAPEPSTFEDGSGSGSGSSGSDAPSGSPAPSTPGSGPVGDALDGVRGPIDGVGNQVQKPLDDIFDNPVLNGGRRGRDGAPVKIPRVVDDTLQQLPKTNR